MGLIKHYVHMYSANELGGSTVDTAYGIEVEAEGFDPDLRPIEARALSRYWSITNDGSLRNDGVEFVSKILAPERVEQAVRLLYARTRAHWTPSIRTGVHVHVSMLPRTFAELKRVFQYYALVEPLLFGFVGAEREENIYCVPWYRAPGEATILSDVINRNSWGSISETCKYSALFAGPLSNFGTIEFRHAPTFHSDDMLMLWVRMVMRVADSYRLPDFGAAFSTMTLRDVVRAVLGPQFDSLRMSDDAAEDLILSTGALEVAQSLESCTYNSATPWGTPGMFHVASTREQYGDINAMSEEEANLLMPRTRRPRQPIPTEDTLRMYDIPTTAGFSVAANAALEEARRRARRMIEERITIIEDEGEELMPAPEEEPDYDEEFENEDHSEEPR